MTHQRAITGDDVDVLRAAIDQEGRGVAVALEEVGVQPASFQ
jgi:hypothetical protein